MICWPIFERASPVRITNLGANLDPTDTEETTAGAATEDNCRPTGIISKRTSVLYGHVEIARRNDMINPAEKQPVAPALGTTTTSPTPISRRHTGQPGQMLIPLIDQKKFQRNVWDNINSGKTHLINRKQLCALCFPCATVAESAGRV